MKLTFSNSTPDATIPFWVFCEGSLCAGQLVNMKSKDATAQSRSSVTVPLQNMSTQSVPDRWGAEIIIPHSGAYTFSLGEQSQTVFIREHRVLSFGEEFVWVFAAIVTVVSALFIFMSRKNKAKSRIKAAS